MKLPIKLFSITLLLFGFSLHANPACEEYKENDYLYFKCVKDSFRKGKINPILENLTKERKVFIWENVKVHTNKYISKRYTYHKGFRTLLPINNESTSIELRINKNPQGKVLDMERQEKKANRLPIKKIYHGKNYTFYVQNTDESLEVLGTCNVISGEDPNEINFVLGKEYQYIYECKDEYHIYNNEILTTYLGDYSINNKKGAVLLYQSKTLTKCDPEKESLACKPSLIIEETIAISEFQNKEIPVILTISETSSEDINILIITEGYNE